MTKTNARTQSPVAATTPIASASPAAVASIKRYDETFRKSAVEHWIKTGQPGAQIAAELGVSYPTLKEWKRRYHGDALPEHGNLEPENRTLQAELARVREQHDILQETLGLFTEPSKPATKPSNA